MTTNLNLGQYSAMPAWTIAAFAVLSLFFVTFALIIVRVKIIKMDKQITTDAQN